MKKNRCVIIGSSTAAVAAIEALREKGGAFPISVISREKNYSRPLISYFLEGKIKESELGYRSEVFSAENGVDAHFGEEAVKLDTARKQVILRSGRKAGYSKLLIATGGRPFIPEPLSREISPFLGKSVFTFTTLEDALKIKKLSEKQKGKNRKAMVIGGGMIGIKAAASLKHLGYDPAVIELSDRILGNAFDKDASRIAVSHLEKNGIKVMLSNTVVKLTGTGGFVKKVKFKSGIEIPFDLIVAAIGVVPDISLVKGSAVKTNRGIIVDEHMMTSVKDVYAAGDVAETPDIILGENRSLAIWPLAYRQGRIAGLAIAGREEKYTGGFMMNSVDIMGLPVITIGASTYPGSDCEVFTDLDEQGYSYKKIIVKNNRVIGAIFVNDIDRAGIITGMMKDKIDVESFKKEILGEKFGYIYVPKEYRSGKVVPLEV